MFMFAQQTFREGRKLVVDGFNKLFEKRDEPRPFHGLVQVRWSRCIHRMFRGVIFSRFLRS